MAELELPADLKLLTDEDVVALEAEWVAEFDRIGAEPDVTGNSVSYQLRLADGLDKIRVEAAARQTRREQQEALAKANLLAEQERVTARVHGDPEPTEEAPAATPAIDAEAIAAAAAAGVSRALLAAIGAPGDPKRPRTLTEVRERASLAAAAEHMPEPAASERSTKGLNITANVDVTGSLGRNGQIASLRDLTKLFNDTARGLRISRDGNGPEVPVATIHYDYPVEMDDRTKLGEVQEWLHDSIEPKANDLEALTAGGGWCAPSQISYDFFNIACADGGVDLPTVGITRGGLQYPTSPSLADAVYTIKDSTGTIQSAQGFPTFAGPAGMTVNTEPWVWTETDDVATVTGNPNKPTLRVPCPGYNSIRLECYGITMTAGNLTDSAFPEATANTLQLLRSAWAHAQNARIISQMVTLSTVTATISGSANRPAFNQIVSGMALAAADYRARFGMCEKDVLELVAPYWIPAVITADLAWRVWEAEFVSVTQAQIESYLRDRGVRVQWVNDWQVRGSGQFGNGSSVLTAWPTQADFLLYAPGTFIKGNGLTLDLGVVRDSVLNAENDFTAAWAEECHFIARIGHESRRYTVGFTVNGSAPGAQTLGAFV